MTGLEREAQGESGGKQLLQPPPLVQQGEMLCHHRWNSLMVTAWLRAGRVMFLRKL